MVHQCLANIIINQNRIKKDGQLVFVNINLQHIIVTMVAIIVVMMAEAGLNARKVLAYMKWEEKMKKLKEGPPK